jgi:hypothetical protein
MLALLIVASALAGSCPWAGAASPTVEALWDHVTINGVDYPVDTPAERGIFAGQLRDCNADAAVPDFYKWQENRDKVMNPIYAAMTPRVRDRFVETLEGTKPPRR